LYAKLVVRAINDNYLSCSFCISKGVQKGDPLSPISFILWIECLAASLQQDCNFQGLAKSNLASQKIFNLKRLSWASAAEGRESRGPVARTCPGNH